MKNIREATICVLSQAIKNGEPIRLRSYEPPPPVSPQERLMDAVIQDTLKATKEGRIPAFSGIGV